MKVVESKMNKMVLTELESLDPVTVLIEEFEEGRAQVIIKCYDKSWTSYWGSMGGDIKKFFTRTDVCYLVNCFDRGISDVDYSKIDKEASTEHFNEKLLNMVLEKRRDYLISKTTASSLWSAIKLGDFTDRMKYPEHTYDNYAPHFMYVDEIKEVFYDEDEFNEFCYDNIREVYEKNHEYDYLSRIVTAVREAVINHYQGSV